MESARLYEETRRRAERERLTSEIIAKMRATNDPRTILKTAALELRKALNVDRAQLLVETPPSSASSTGEPAPDAEPAWPRRPVIPQITINDGWLQAATSSSWMNGGKTMSERESFDPEWIADTSQEQSPAKPQPETSKKTPLVIAIANQKGGVAKTTTVVSLGGALANHAKEVLLIDLDAQANLTLALGKDPSRLRGAITDVLFHSATLLSVSRETTIPGLDLVPSNSGMELAERFLPVRKDYETILSRTLNDELRPQAKNRRPARQTATRPAHPTNVTSRSSSMTM